MIDFSKLPVPALYATRDGDVVRVTRVDWAAVVTGRPADANHEYPVEGYLLRGVARIEYRWRLDGTYVAPGVESELDIVGLTTPEGPGHEDSGDNPGAATL